MPDLPGGTVTFLLTDVEGSTALWEDASEAMRAALARHDRLFEEIVHRHSGVHIRPRGEGDSRFAVFAAAGDAVAAALAIQQAFAGEPWPTPRPIKVRLGVHTGEAELRDGDYYGSAVNRCARLRNIGHGGQVLVSEATAALSRDFLQVGVSLLDLGEQRLKDLSRPERVFQVVHRDLTSDFPPLRSLDAVPNNLPRQLTSFVGRDLEMAEIHRLLAATSLLTLVGTGGAGKTRLSLQAAADVVDAYRDGVWLVELAPLADPSLVAQAVCSALGIREQAGRSATLTLQEYLRSRTLLLVLDNCEHLVSACAALADGLLRACPDLKVLATSREALGIAGETTWRVPSLSLPDLSVTVRDDPQVATTLSQYAAVRLFVDRAVAVLPDFAVSNQNAPAVAQICHRLDGVPLAIELAAARVRVLTPEQIATRLDDRFRLLTGGSRMALPRQQTLRALVDWSYDLLSEAERTLLQRLSIFAGGWTLEAAEAVCAGRGIDADDVLDLLSQLVDKSLVIAEAGGRANRYRLLETLRQYGAEKLAASGDVTRLGRAHRDFFLAFAERAAFDFWGPDLSTWIKLLDADHDNLRAAMALTLAEEDEDSVELGLRLAAAIGPYRWVRNLLGEGSRDLKLALGEDPSGCRPTDAGASLPIPSGPPRHFLGAHPRVAALNMLNSNDIVWPDFASAYAHAEAAELLSMRVGDQIGLANALIVQGIVAKDRGEPARSIAPLEQALRLARGAGHRWTIWRAVSNLAEAHIFLGNDDRAKVLIEEGQPIARSIGLNYGLAHFSRFLGLIALARGDLAQAIAQTEQSLQRYRELGAARGPDTALNQLGQILLARGELAGAEARFCESLHLRHHGGEVVHRNIATSLEGLAGVAIAAFADQAVAQALRAARLLGAASAERETYATPMRSFECPTFDLVEAAARGRLGDEAYGAAYAEGRAMTMEQAVAYALEGTDPDGEE